jgi:hypothetical protein
VGSDIWHIDLAAKKESDEYHRMPL